MGSKKCFNVKKIFSLLFVENEKNSRDLLLILGVPTPKFRGTYLEGGGSPRGEQNFFAFLDDSDHV